MILKSSSSIGSCQVQSQQVFGPLLKILAENNLAFVSELFLNFKRYEAFLNQLTVHFGSSVGLPAENLSLKFELLLKLLFLGLERGPYKLFVRLKDLISHA